MSRNSGEKGLIKGRIRKEDLLNHEKYGRIFRLVENYGGGLDEWERKNEKIRRQLRQAG